MTIWFATGNMHKKAELAAILNHSVQVRVLTPADAGFHFDPEETGNTFYENALLKARELHTLLYQQRPPLFSAGDPVIADDSGLCVDALDGRPGIFSARYTGKHPLPPSVKKLEAAERNALLLEEIGDNPLRSARFACAMVLLFNPDRFFLAQETLEGEIVKNIAAAQGTGGFGYDPILYIPALGRTVAELSEAEKNKISHRGKAGTIIGEMLRKILIKAGIIEYNE